jgi:hypothetical protein
MGRPREDQCKRGHLMRETRRLRSNGKTYCIECKKVSERQRGPRTNMHATYRKNHLWKAYRMTVMEYDEMLEKQDGVCAICGGKNSGGLRLCVDHDHDTDHIRGLLCMSCNTALGLLKDDPELLTSASRYLCRNS